MPTLFDEDDEPGIRRLTRQKLIDAYAAELEAHPPVGSCAGDSAPARAARRHFAERDVKRVYAAAARLGCTISLAAIPAPNKTKSIDKGGDG
jgi:hypothetical protein